MKDGLQNPDVANPLADFHFLMINYMDKMGKKSPLLTGKQKFSSLRDWDVKTATQDLQKVHDLMGLEHGLTVGVKRLYRTDEGPIPMCFDPDTCPLSKTEEYLDHCRGCIRIYNGAVQTLERRIAEEGVGTSAKQHAISQEQKGEDDESENDESEDGGSENGESEDTESDDAAGNSDVKRVNNDENDDESDEDEVAKTISEESKEAGSKEAEAETKGGAGAETEVGESSNAQRFNNDQNEINAELLDESVKAACNVELTLTQETIIKFPQFFDGGEAKDAE
ncbi:1-aminocyclopropane-1-carboxylate synthase [Trifolium repens]|nr:1-aminocyclopropane-1-carboxylate synthase [Trifolium repens]